MPGIFYLSSKNRDFSGINAGFSGSYCYFLRGNAYFLPGNVYSLPAYFFQHKRHFCRHYFNFCIQKSYSRIQKSRSCSFCVALCFILAAGLHKKCKRHIPPIKKRAIKKNAPPLMGAPLSHIMPANQITRGLACHFSRFPPLIDNLSIKLFFVRFCALCGAFCGFWSMPHAIRV